MTPETQWLPALTSRLGDLVEDWHPFVDHPSDHRYAQVVIIDQNCARTVAVEDQEIQITLAVRATHQGIPAGVRPKMTEPEQSPLRWWLAAGAGLVVILSALDLRRERRQRPDPSDDRGLVGEMVSDALSLNPFHHEPLPPFPGTPDDEPK